MIPEASVVIPTHRRRASVERALQALSHQSLDPDRYEVVVSIDGDGEGTAELANAFPARCAILVLSGPKKGRAAACNAGAARARGRLLIFLDDDMEPEPQCLAAHLEAHAAGARLGVVGAVPISLDPPCRPVVQYVGRKFNAHLDTLSKPGASIGLRGFYSGNFSIPRRLFFEIGGFDQDFQVYGNEDVELAARMSAAGIHLVFSPEARARQHYEKDFAELARDTISKGRTSVLAARKNPETLERVRLGTYGRASRKWRCARAVLLTGSRMFPRLPEAIVRLMGWLERRRPTRLPHYYALATDYFFWLGAFSELSPEEPLRRRVLLSRPRPGMGHDPNGHPVH